jgi:hypothetical protein
MLAVENDTTLNALAVDHVRSLIFIHRSPGHHVDGGSLADIFVGRKATRWLRLYG